MDLTTVYVSPPQSEPTYLKLYLDGLPGLRKIPLYCWPVLLWMFRLMPYASGDVSFEFGGPMRRKAAGELDLSETRVDHAVTDLVKAGAILRVDRGLYRFNPMFFARGEWKDIQKLRGSGQ